MDIEIVRSIISRDEDFERLEEEMEDMFNSGFKALDVGCHSVGDSDSSKTICVGVFYRN